MDKVLLTIDWDYFINVHSQHYMSYRENQVNLLEEWYRRHLICLQRNEHLENFYNLAPFYKTFWKQAKKALKLKKTIHVIVTEGHEEAYKIAKEWDCTEVYSLDAHSDLGYGGLAALEFEINCANWLGKLLKEKYINKANIIYSPYTKEDEEDFKEIMDAYEVHFLSLEELFKREIDVAAIHICRSGPWTPPWYDEALDEFIKQISESPVLQIEVKRSWKPKALNLADQINCFMGIL